MCSAPLLLLAFYLLGSGGKLVTSCYLVTLLPCCLVTLLPCYLVTLLPCYLVAFYLLGSGGKKTGIGPFGFPYPVSKSGECPPDWGCEAERISREKG